MHCASAQRPLGGVGAFIDAEVPNLYRDARAWGRRHSGFLHRGETATDANPLVSAAQTSAEKSLIQGRVKYNKMDVTGIWGSSSTAYQPVFFSWNQRRTRSPLATPALWATWSAKWRSRCPSANTRKLLRWRAL